MAESERFSEILTALADGTPVDWATAEATANTDEDRATIQRLRRIEQVAAIQRRLPAPAMWGHLELLEKIGEGAFGEVYRAHDPRLARDVALKLLHEPVAANGPRASTVIEEGRLLARVRHPNVVTVHGAESLNGQVGIWTEFIQGQTLHAIVTEHGPLPIADVASIGADLCRALGAVHDAGLLHRDIKAQNVMRETGGRIVLMDFGTGRDRDLAAARKGDVSGTPLYLAPELFTGSQATVASDIYALGVLLFFLLTGEFPVSGRTLKDVQAAHRERRAVRIGGFVANVPDGLRHAIDKALALDPSARHETATAFAAMLSPAVAQRANGAASQGSPWPVRALVLASGLVLAALILFAIMQLQRRSIDDTRTGSRRVWASQLVHTEGSVSPDGRYMSTIGDDGNLTLHDFESDKNRRLTDGGSWLTTHAWESAISRDGKQIAYDWFDGQSNHGSLRVIAFDPTRASAPRTLIDDPDVSWIIPYDWSPDGRWVALSLGRSDRTVDIGRIAAAGGKVETFKAIDWRGTTKMAFSPDGRFLAYDRAVDETSQRDVFVMDTQTRKETTVVRHWANDTVAGWAPDGASLLFMSDRSNSLIGVWAAPMANGAPTGDVKPLDPDLGSRVFGIGVTASGTLFYGKQISSVNVYTADVDFESGRVLGEPRGASESYLWTNTGPDWSRDGRLLFSSDRAGNLKSISATSAGGPNRDWLPKLESFQRPRWAPDGSITVQGTDLRGQQGFFQIDADSGETFPILACASGSRCSQASWTRDMIHLIYRRQTPGSAIVVRNMKSGEESAPLTDMLPNGLDGVSLSPDERYVAYIRRDRRASVIYVRPFADGPSRPLIRVDEPTQLANLVEWTPDSRRLIFARSFDDPASMAISSVPIGEGPEVPIPDLKARPGANAVRINPMDGRVAFSAGEHNLEIWTLKNFLPVVR